MVDLFSRWFITENVRITGGGGEWPSGLDSLRQVTEVLMDDLGGLTSQLTSSSFRRDVKLGVPGLGAACNCGPRSAFSS